MRVIDQQKIEALRNAALQMVVDEGLKGLSMQKLAGAAGVSPATIYIYYQDRNDLLNKLYLFVFDSANLAALKGFDPQMPLAAGLKVLWLNRFRYFSAHPYHYLFAEQFINSPLIATVEDEDKTYGKQMRLFYANAKKNNEVSDLPVEVYWSVAFAPLYQLIKFRLQKNRHIHKRKDIGEDEVLQCLGITLKALGPGYSRPVRC